jgi:hypothetical protein
MFLENKRLEISFGEMSEQRMGSAYACDIYLNTEGMPPLLLHERSTGSALWDSKNSTVYFVVWTDTKKGLMQQLAAYSLVNSQISIFDTQYSVLNLESIEGHFIKAIENPYSKPKTIFLDIEKEKISSEVHWTSVESDAILSERQKYLTMRKT